MIDECIYTCLCGGGHDDGQVEQLAEFGVCTDIVAELCDSVVPNQLKQAKLVVDDEKDRLVLIEPFESERCCKPCC